MKRLAVVANPKDNVATAVTDLKAGTTVHVRVAGQDVAIRLRSDVPVGHKFALKDINLHEDVLKYGECIGAATAPIAAGEHVHVHNVESKRGRGDLVHE